MVPLVIGHRGAAAQAPENTLAGLRLAKALGAAQVEFDVRLTGDGEPVLMHDARIERTTDGHGAVAELSFAEIERRDAGGWFAREFRGERVPHLVEAVKLLGRLDMGAVIELKPAPGAAARLAQAVAAVLAACWPAHLSPPLVSSFDAEALAAAREAMPAVARALVLGAVPGDWRARATALGAAALHLDHRALDAAAVAAVTAELPLCAYTVNEAQRARDLAAWGVAGIFTDCPDLIIAAIGRKY